MELSEEEIEFIKRYELEAESKVPKVKPKRKIKLTKLFYAWIGFLTVTPFILSVLFMIAMARLSQLLDNEGVRQLTKNYSPEEVEKLSQETGFQDLDFYLNIYQSRIEIVAGIFTVFILLIGLSFMLRFIVIAAQKEKDREDDEE